MQSLYFLLMTGFLALFVGCASSPPLTQDPQAMTNSPEASQKQTQAYTSESWQGLIPESCQAYFDGCNQCRRTLGAKAVACTRKACQSYQKPYCLDKTNTPKPANHWALYSCHDGRTVKMYVGEYRTSAFTLALPAGKVMLDDNYLAKPLTLEQSASGSGSRYQGDGADFWLKGTSAHYTPSGFAAIACTLISSGDFESP